MSTATQEILRVCETLPPDKQNKVADFARFLQAQQGDAAWEKILASTQPRPKLEMFLSSPPVQKMRGFLRGMDTAIEREDDSR